jgi:general secretion pathway protein L
MALYNEFHMRTLIIQLPPGLPSPNLAYAHARVEGEAGSRPLALQWGAAALLPAADRQSETVALVPAAALSWHRVELPAGLHKQAQRVQAALQGLLEDRLLDDPEHMHLALQADWAHNPRPWVAVCDRAWLSAHLQALEQAGLPVHRIVPELSPGAASSPVQITALGDGDTGWLWVSHPERGVWGQPCTALRQAGLGAHEQLGLSETEQASATLQAEPAAVAVATDLLGAGVRLMPPAQHWLAALAADWDLAQFGLRANARSRQLKVWQRTISQLWHSPAWRPARWGLWLLLAGHLVGLNAWAWKTRADWQTQQSSWAQILRETFPQTTLVVDAPLQMAQQVERLRQSSGQLGAGDLEAMLAALGQALPPGLAAPRQWSYQPGQMRLQDFQPNATQQQALQQSLSTLGYTWKAQGDGWLISPQSEAKP